MVLEFTTELKEDLGRIEQKLFEINKSMIEMSSDVKALRGKTVK